MTAELSVMKPSEQQDLTAIERVVVMGDLSKLTSDERWSYYRGVCQSLKLNPFTRPFDYLTLSGKMVLYAKKDCADQLRKIHGISIDIVGRERIDDLYVVTARATTGSGRRDEEIGAVTIGNLRGDALANALMKATTKAKRRVTLSICGLGMLDETEIETIPGARIEDAEALHRTPPADLPVDPPGPSDVARHHAIRRSNQLAEHAREINHPDADKIGSAVPETMNPRTLRAWVEKLEATFPDVEDPDEVAF